MSVRRPPSAIPVELPELPVTAVIPGLRQALERGHALLAAPPGSGKTTLAPLALLEAPWLADQGIVMLEPRRLAARAAAARMAQLLGEPVGETVGYQVRFDRRVSARTRIEVVTEGILTRRLQTDPELTGIGLLIFDEFHERNLHGDLALALALDSASLREDLRLLVMSATLESSGLSRLLGDAPLIRGEGRSYPVDIRYAARDAECPLAAPVAGAVRKALADTVGDLLVFLPGAGEIRATEHLLREADVAAQICPLYGDLDREAQDRAIRPDPDGRRRVVLATDIAETSLTIEGIGTVVDSGWCRQPRFDPNRGLTRLVTERISQASATQRAGRAGRLGPGVCYRLWSEARQQRLEAQRPAEILSADLAPLALELAAWGVSDPGQLAWLDPPPVGAYAQALELLRRLDALDAHDHITAEGRRMAGLGVHPRLAHLLLKGEAAGVLETAADLAAILSERDPLRRTAGEQRPVDLEDRVTALRAWRAGKGAQGLDTGACRRLEQAAGRWRRQLKGDARGSPVSIGGLLSLAYPDRIAQCTDPSAGRYRLANGRAALLPPGDTLSGQEYIVAAQLDAGQREGRIFLAAALDIRELRELHAAHLQTGERVQWDARGGSVLAERRQRLDQLVLSRESLRDLSPELQQQALLEGLRHSGLDVLPWDETSRQLQARIQCMSEWDAQDGWPDVSDEALLADAGQWLGPWLSGMNRLEHLRRLDLTEALSGLIGWERQRQLNEWAPTHLTVPSGSRLRLHYAAGHPPVLKVRLQEMFGLADTPRVARGKVAVMLHLLSPAQRPVQVTQDLRGFWDRTYAEVKKELKGRYPKHHWPDDPWAATPTARAKPRR